MRLKIRLNYWVITLSIIVEIVIIGNIVQGRLHYYRCFICFEGGFSPHECAAARGSKPPTLVVFTLVGGLVRRSATHQL